MLIMSSVFKIFASSASFIFHTISSFFSDFCSHLSIRLYCSFLFPLPYSLCIGILFRVQFTYFSHLFVSCQVLFFFFHALLTSLLIFNYSDKYFYLVYLNLLLYMIGIGLVLADNINLLLGATEVCRWRG